MKRRILYILIAFTAFVLPACNDFLEEKPLDRVPAEQLLNDPNGIKVLLANLYNRMPVEDFRYNPGQSFNYKSDGGSSFVAHGWSSSFFTDDATMTHGSGAGPISDGYWDYAGIRQVNQFLDNLEVVKLDETQKNRLKSEAHFIRAYMYFGLVKRYGGVPLVKETLEYLQGSDNANLFIARSTEKETWDFILAECDLAAANLPAIVTSAEGSNRATKWAALALKSRAALHAASIAKFWDKAPLTGEAVDKKLVGGMTIADANAYYKVCLDASKAIIDGAGKSLYKANPSSNIEAAKNYQEIFQNPSSGEVKNEVIFAISYIDGSITALQGHCYDVHFNPSQTATGYLAYGRFSPSLNLVDIYEDYTDDGTGKSAKIVTRTDGNENYVVADPTKVDLAVSFKKYDNLIEPFINKDARLLASIIVPGATWKNVQIIIQGGLIKQDGSKLIYTESSAPGKDGKTYFTYGASTPSAYSGFRGLGNFDNANFTCSGFSLKKFLTEGKNAQGVRWSSTTDYIDFRLAEIYLNYAEAAIESGSGDAGLAKTYLNMLRKRAGHKDEIPATIENILKERRVEFAFEGPRYWDLVRRRDYHTVFATGTRRQALIPVLDLREATPKYIFVRANNYYDEKANGVVFQPMSYYKGIPGIGTNKLVQNPQY
ncbi:MAG: RagB/SusD family nutrient uptake outer membrane protein [Prolixibacteraceae bacterium]|nr:RagB/SusD family nutrient uptake outer membrane protein [Prolixibacteraceae bacterium]